MVKASLRCAALTAFLTLAPFLRAQSGNVELANLREDVRLLTQRIGDLQLRVEQLERENQDLREKNSGAARNYATVSQLNDSVADLNRAIKSSAAATKSETLQQVSIQMEKLAHQTNVAMESLAKNVTTTRSPVAAPTFSDDYPKQGTTYTVQKGDTLATIVKKTGASAKDIINANKLSDPSKIQAGQTFFIPGGK
jgi:LysM repeat protein